jgi:hypothetical protein
MWSSRWLQHLQVQYLQSRNYLLCTDWCVAASQRTGHLVFVSGLLLSYAHHLHFLPAYVTSLKVNVDYCAGGPSLKCLTFRFVLLCQGKFYNLPWNEPLPLSFTSYSTRRSKHFPTQYWITYVFKNMSLNILKLGNTGPTVAFPRTVFKAGRFVLSGLVWFGLFVHPFSHTCNNGHVNYRLQFIY